MSRPDRCLDCGKAAPEINGDETAIFTRASGWRLVLRKTDEGVHIPEWRCTDCWKAYRAAGGHLRAPSRPPGSKR